VILDTPIDLWLRKGFPKGSPSDVIDDLHGRLALVDSWVAEAVLPFVEQGMVQPVAVDILGELDALDLRLAEAKAGCSASDLARLDDYRAYGDVLRRAYEDFLLRTNVVRIDFP
jgi:hypothetical protein